MLNNIKQNIKVYTKLDVFKNKDECGRILTYQILDYDEPKNYNWIAHEFNTLKELNKFLKNQTK